MLGRQRLLKVASATVVALLSGTAAYAATTATTGSAHARAHASEVSESSTSSTDDTSTSESTTSSTEETTTTEATTTTNGDTSTTVAPNTPTTTCNHGADVSRVAHEAPRGNGNEHGKAVSAAAHQKCDHTAGADDATNDTATTEPDGSHHHDNSQDNQSGEKD
jgi:hypothetical protein